MAVQVKFCGASGMVTGSCYLVRVPEGQFLVDCGMFQGNKTIRELNYKDFAFNPKDISFVLLTHAHIDHSGLIPKLYKAGFKGSVYTTAGTRDLLTIMLPDSGYIQETEVKYVNRKNNARGLPQVDPIYTREDAVRCLDKIKPVPFSQWQDDLGLGVKARFWNAGHILGSSSIEVELPTEEGKTVRALFSGDIGPEEKSFHPDPAAPSDIDYLFVESTYGDRERADVSLETRRNLLRDEIQKAMKAGGNLIIPSFAIERTQELLLDIDLLIQEGAISNANVFLDSPLAVEATQIFSLHKNELEDIGDRKPFSGGHLTFITDVEQSKGLNDIRSGAIIMAASGMCEAGRIRHHLKNNLWDSKSTVLFVGYQAPGTLGHILLNGAKSVRIHGQEVQVNAHIRSIGNYSAHADKTELVDWVHKRLPVRHGIFLVHGENTSRAGLKKSLEGQGIDAKGLFEPELDDVFELSITGKPLVVSDVSRVQADVAAAPTDWHNEYAQVLLDLAEELRALPTPKARSILLEEIKQVIAKKKRDAA